MWKGRFNDEIDMIKQNTETETETRKQDESQVREGTPERGILAHLFYCYTTAMQDGIKIYIICSSAASGFKFLV